MKTGITRILSLALLCFFSLAASAFATPAVADLWAAVDITTVNGQVLTLLTAMVGIRLGFLVYKYVKRVMGAA